MKKRVRKNWIIAIIVIAVVILVGILIYNYSQKGVLLAPSENLLLNPRFEDITGNNLKSVSSSSLSSITTY